MAQGLPPRQALLAVAAHPLAAPGDAECRSPSELRDKDATAAIFDDSDVSTGCHTPLNETDSSQSFPPTLLDSEVSDDGLVTPLLFKEKQPELPVYRSSMLVVLPAFAAYACLFSLQHEVKEAYRIADDDSAASHNFSRATSSLFLFKLIFRFMHSIAFGNVSPRGRLYIGLAALGSAMCILTLVTAQIVAPLPVYLFAAYALGGAGIGSFEANVQMAFTFLGMHTKQYAVMGMPLGVCLITIGGFLMRYLAVPVYVIYLGAISGIVAAALVLRFRIPSSRPEDSLPLPGTCALLPRKPPLIVGFNSWAEWVPGLWSRCLVSTIDMTFVEVFAPALLLFVYNTPLLSLLGPPAWPNVVMVEKDLFFVLYNLCAGVGSVAGRYMGFRLRRLFHPAWLHSLHLVGAALIVTSMPLHALAPAALWLAPFGVFILLFADGLIYVLNCRRIDETVPQPYLTAAFSCWLFAADLGSTIGAFFVASIRDWVCFVP